MLTTIRVCKISGVRPHTLLNWVRQGLISPAKKAHGPGSNGNEFNTMQSLGIMVGNKVFNTKRSCSLEYFRGVVKGFEDMREGDLHENFSSGEVYFEGLDDKGGVVLSKRRGLEGIDVQATMETLIVEIRNGRKY